MISYNLVPVLDELDISMNMLSAVTGIRSNTIIDLAKGNTKRIEIETIEGILDALNEVSKGKKLNKYYQIQHIIQYESENPPQSNFSPLFTKLKFELLRTTLGKIKIDTKIPGHERINILLLLIMNEEKITQGVVYTYQGANNVVDAALLKTKEQLITYYLAEDDAKSTYNILRLNDKGREFVRLLNIHGIS